MKYYTDLKNILTLTGINFEDSGHADDNLGKQVSIAIEDEQGSCAAVTFYYNISLDGKETFVCQE